MWSVFFFLQHFSTLCMPYDRYEKRKTKWTQFTFILKLSCCQVQSNPPALTSSHLHPALSKWRPLCSTLPLWMPCRVDWHPLSQRWVVHENKRNRTVMAEVGFWQTPKIIHWGLKYMKVSLSVLKCTVLIEWTYVDAVVVTLWANHNLPL